MIFYNNIVYRIILFLSFGIPKWNSPPEQPDSLYLLIKLSNTKKPSNLAGTSIIIKYSFLFLVLFLFYPLFNVSGQHLFFATGPLSPYSVSALFRCTLPTTRHKSGLKKDANRLNMQLVNGHITAIKNKISLRDETLTVLIDLLSANVSMGRTKLPNPLTWRHYFIHLFSFIFHSPQTTLYIEAFISNWNLIVTCIHSEQEYQISRTIVLHHAYHFYHAHSPDEIILDFQHQYILPFYRLFSPCH